MTLTRKRLDTLHRVRAVRRDRVRAAVAKLAEVAGIATARVKVVEAEREETAAAIRAATAGGPIDIDRAAALRLHALRLGLEAASLSRESLAAADRLRRGQKLLARADADVKAIGRLGERLATDERIAAERRSDRDATDRFSAGMSRGAGETL